LAGCGFKMISFKMFPSVAKIPIFPVLYSVLQVLQPVLILQKEYHNFFRKKDIAAAVAVLQATTISLTVFFLIKI